jgi:protein-S-isoprenylcysteine O-methyltransferase Ste14
VSLVADDRYDWVVDGSRLTLILAQWEYLVLYLASAAIASGVVVNFALKDREARELAVEERVVVATFTMAAFFVLAFIVGRLGIGRLSLPHSYAFVSKLSGCVVVSYAATINIAARVALGQNWSNQIEIAEDQRLVRRWPYNWSRHPLYGSMVLFGVGMAVLMLNAIVLLAMLVVFLPAMIFRSAREESLLIRSLGDEYHRYRREVPMLIPLPRSRAAR